MKDVEQQVCNDILKRQEVGIKKYGTTVADNPLNLKQWMQHTYEELLDAAVYLKRAMQEMEANNVKTQISGREEDPSTNQSGYLENRICE